MVKIFKILQIILLFTALSILVFPAYGCQNSAPEDTPVKNINIGQNTIDKGDWKNLFHDMLWDAEWINAQTGPYNTTIYTFSEGYQILIHIKLKSELETAVTFTKFTFYNKETGTEEIVDLVDDYTSWGLVDDLGPLDPGADNLWGAQVPYEGGEYELRLYLEEEVVASAILEVS